MSTTMMSIKAADYQDLGSHSELFCIKCNVYYARLYGFARDELCYILDPKEVHGEDFPGRHSVCWRRGMGWLPEDLLFDLENHMFVPFNGAAGIELAIVLVILALGPTIILLLWKHRRKLIR